MLNIYLHVKAFLVIVQNVLLWNGNPSYFIFQVFIVIFKIKLKILVYLNLNKGLDTSINHSAIKLYLSKLIYFYFLLGAYLLTSTPKNKKHCIEFKLDFYDNCNYST